MINFGISATRSPTQPESRLTLESVEFNLMKDENDVGFHSRNRQRGTTFVLMFKHAAISTFREKP